MKIYTGTFVKKDGKTREMLFAKIKDLPDGFLPEGKGGQGTKLPEGMELVWDVKERYYRVFNYNTIVGKLKEAEINSATLTHENGEKHGY